MKRKDLQKNKEIESVAFYSAVVGSLGFLQGTRHTAQSKALCQCNRDIVKTAVFSFLMKVLTEKASRLSVLMLKQELQQFHYSLP